MDQATVETLARAVAKELLGENIGSAILFGLLVFIASVAGNFLAS
jgi:hypothetical protein